VDIGLFAGNHCELITDPLPVKTKAFTLAILEYVHPWEAITYSYRKDAAPNDTTNNLPGDLLLTITERKNNHVKGTISGTNYRSDVGQNMLQ